METVIGARGSDVGTISVRNLGYHDGKVSLYAASILRNKKAVCIDMKTPAGVALVRIGKKRATSFLSTRRCVSPRSVPSMWIKLLM